MATKVHMEALSPTMEEGQVVKWRKAEGDKITKGEVLADVETDKATMELVARGDGVLRGTLKKEGETAAVGEVIAIIAEEGEDVPVVADKSPKSKSDVKIEATPEPAKQAAFPVSPAAAPPAKTPAPPAATESPVAPAPTRSAEGPGGRLKASPLARRLAQESGVELSGIKGSGPGGRIVKRDVEVAAERGTTGVAVAVSPPRSGCEGPEFEDIKVSQMRKTIARRLSESIGPVPHFFLTIDVDMERAVQARARINSLLEDRGEKISLNDLIIRAVGASLRQNPAVNASWQGEHIRRYSRVHIGVAVAVDDGLITPVIRDAHLKGVAEIAREVRELAGRAREKKLKPEEYTGATFSISNLGMFGIHEFTAVINPPEAGILAIGQVADTPVVMGGQVVVRPRMRVTLSCDHRVVDGATGARFLQTLRAMLEEPAAILI